MEWEPNDPRRPQPPVVSPGPPPSDAIILFGGSDVSEWETFEGEPIRWRFGYNLLEVGRGAGSIRTKKSFGDCQFHLEWQTERYPTGSGQDRGNSGILLMGLYEIQILDSFENETYADGHAGAVYGQHPPLANAMKAPGEWQTYDIAFRRPRLDEEGFVVSAGLLTVLHNGILVQNNIALLGPTPAINNGRPTYDKHPNRLPLVLQEHGNTVKFRNIWIRDLES